MADAKSNEEVDLREVSRDGRHSTYKSVKPDAEDAGPQVEQILGKPSEPKSSKGAKGGGS